MAPLTSLPKIFSPLAIYLHLNFQNAWLFSWDYSQIWQTSQVEPSEEGESHGEAAPRHV